MRRTFSTGPSESNTCLVPVGRNVPVPLGCIHQPAQLYWKLIMNGRIFLLVPLSAVFLASCGGPASNNANNRSPNVNIAITNANTSTDANVPVASPAPTAEVANTANANIRSAASSDRPVPLGTPASNSGKSRKSSPTPTPGIPSAEEMKRLMTGQPRGNPNQPPPAMQGSPMMKSNRPLGGRMSGNSNRPQ